jgi:outer membrane cobalamin receptor
VCDPVEILRGGIIQAVIAARASIALLFAVRLLGGLRLDEAISSLQREGLTVIYSSALVKPAMRVEAEPRSPSARGKLEEILAPHGLRVIEGPHHELLVVAAEKPAPAAAAPQPKPEFSDEIVVTPGRNRVLSEPPSDHQTLPHDEINRKPNPPDDATRAVQHFPGISGADASAAVNIHGSATDETLIAIDGLELNEPFHLKDFFNVFSTLDSAAVGRIDLNTGAFPAQWGDRLGGVIDMDTLSPASTTSNSIWAGTLNGGLISIGSTQDRNTSWLLSARGWYPDGVFNFDKDRTELINTDCYDVLAKLEHRFSSRTTVSVNFLGAYDTLGYRNFQPAETDKSTATENSSHFWLTSQTDWSDTVSVRTILATGDLTRDRIGAIIDRGPIDITDRREFNFVELKQDWHRSQFAFGFDAKSSAARYDYTRLKDDATIVDTHLRPREQTIGLYASDHVQLSNTAVADLGIRYDRQSLAGRAQISPRLNVLWAINPDSDLRFGWGRYYQSERLNELQIADGVTRFGPPELAEQLTVSFEHRFISGLSFRAELFDKPMTNVRPRFENMLNPIDVFPEAQDDRVKVAPSHSRSSGLEMALAGNAGSRTSWWASYVYSRAIDTINGEKVPRSWDQPNAASAGMNLDLTRGWTAGLAAGFHTGWPTTPMYAVRTAEGIQLVPGPRNSERLPDWFRLDGRVSKSIRTRRGSLLLSLDIINMTNHQNVCCVKDISAYEKSDGTLGVNREDRSIIPFFPSLSARWNF